MQAAPGGETMASRDDLFREAGAYPGGFRFDERVVRVFPDMISRSVPGYELIVPMIGLLARRHAQPNSRLYDLGCSLGAATLAMRRAVQAPGVSIVAVDNAQAMVERARALVADDNSVVPVEVLEADIGDVPIEDASVVVLNFTLQFLPPAARDALIARIAGGLRPGGLLLLSEKLRFDDAESQARQTAWHEDFKRAQGYSDLEIAGKRQALEDVLRPETGAAHLARLEAAGFSSVDRWFQCFAFASFAAIR